MLKYATSINIIKFQVLKEMHRKIPILSIFGILLGASLITDAIAETVEMPSV